MVLYERFFLIPLDLKNKVMYTNNSKMRLYTCYPTTITAQNIDASSIQTIATTQTGHYINPIWPPLSGAQWRMVSRGVIECT